LNKNWLPPKPRSREATMGEHESVLDAPWRMLPTRGTPLDYGVEMPWPVFETFSKTRPFLFLSDKRPND
jgi:hypothetical protein